MIRRAACLLCLALAAAAPPAGIAETATDRLAAATAAVAAAKNAGDHRRALAALVAAYDDLRMVLRDDLRTRTAELAGLDRAIADRAARETDALAALQRLALRPAHSDLWHPDGAIPALRARATLSAVVPRLLAETAPLRQQALSRATQAAARRAALDALAARQAEAERARADLARLQRRRDPHIDAEAARIARSVSDSGREDIAALARALRGMDAPAATLTLPVAPPVAGAIDAQPAAPGVMLAAPADALVRAPFAGTLRFAGRIPGRGLVAILEPAAGTLVILAGLGNVVVDPGEVLAPDDPIGHMPAGTSAQVNTIATNGQGDAGGPPLERLYIEVRVDNTPVDPSLWFRLERTTPR